MISQKAHRQLSEILMALAFWPIFDQEYWNHSHDFGDEWDEERERFIKLMELLTVYNEEEAEHASDVFSKLEKPTKDVGDVLMLVAWIPIIEDVQDEVLDSPTDGLTDEEWEDRRVFEVELEEWLFVTIRDKVMWTFNICDSLALYDAMILLEDGS